MFKGISLTGIERAIKKLAWSQEYFHESILVLATLSNTYIEGKQKTNSIDSIAQIILPWYPQTLAKFDDKKVVVSILAKDFPNIAYEVIVKLLPDQHSITTDIDKPDFLDLDIPEKISMTNKQYFDEVDWYSNKLVSLVTENVHYVARTIKYMTSLTKSGYESFLVVLKSKKIIDLNDEIRYEIWSELLSYINHHLGYQDSDWSLEQKELDRLINISKNISPKDNILKFKRLFTHNEHNLFPDKGDYYKQRKTLNIERTNVLNQILAEKGIEGVKALCGVSESPFYIGLTFAKVDELSDYINEISIFCKNKDDYSNPFLKGFLRGLDNEDLLNQIEDVFSKLKNKKMLIEFVVNLPFKKESWIVAKKWLGDDYELYWRFTDIDAFVEEEDIPEAVVKLNEVKRYDESINCLYRLIMRNIFVESDLIEKTLSKLIRKKGFIKNVNQHAIQKLISYLQKNSLDTENLISIEWAFLPLLTGSYGPEPITLMQEMSRKPDFFLEIIKMCYRPIHEEKPQKGNKVNAKNAWHALFKWNVVPGTVDSEEFSFTNFNSWFVEVKKLSKESGHYEVALQKVGEVLINAPKSDKLWIDNRLARIIDEDDHEHLRRGFRTASYNSRGVHSVDVTGDTDFKIASKYGEKANALKKAGFIRFSNVLYDLEETYLRESKTIAKKYSHD